MLAACLVQWPQNDYEIDVVFRISEEKKKIRYSRSEARILEVLDDVCKSSPFNFPAESRQSKRALSDAVSLRRL